MAADPHFVVVGASLAGLRAVEALRRQGFGGRLTLVGAETHRPYDRPPLSKQILSGTWEAERLPFRQRDGYEGLDVELRLGQPARTLDASERRVVLEDGASLSYDGLVIATGAAPRRLPGMDGLAGIHVLRTVDDALAIRGALAAQPRVVVVGGGYIGLEVAASCRARGLDVTVLETLDVPLSTTLGETLGGAVAALHRSHGVDLRCGVQVEGFVGEEHVQGVRLAGGEVVAADLVIVGIGVRPNVAWLQGAGLDLDDGVLCDAYCATPLPGVVAAGDVARWYNPRYGSAMRVEHWTNAVEMANAAAATLLAAPGQAEPFSPVPYVWSDQYDLKIQIAGRPAGSDELRFAHGAPGDARLVALYGQQGKFVAAVGFNRPAQLIRYRRLLTEGADLEAALAAS